MAIAVMQKRQDGGIEYVGDVAPDTTQSPAQGTNAAVVFTASAVAGQFFCISAIYFGYSAAPTGGNIKIDSPSGTTFINIPVGQAFVHELDFVPNLVFPVNTNVVVTLAAGGSAIVGGLFVHGFYEN